MNRKLKNNIFVKHAMLTDDFVHYIRMHTEYYLICCLLKNTSNPLS